MGLRRMWRRVRSLTERQHNLLAISDLHLGCDLRPGQNLDRPRPADHALASFLEWHADHRTERKPWRLILNGDIVDFVAIRSSPITPISKSATRSASWASRRRSRNASGSCAALRSAIHRSLTPSPDLSTREILFASSVGTTMPSGAGRRFKPSCDVY